MTTSSMKYVLDKLTEKNFKNWKSKIELVLDIEGLLEVVDDTWEEPTNNPLEEWKTWKARDKMARLEILLHVDDKQADIIPRLTTTATMWAKLKELYEPHDGMTKLHTLGALLIMCVCVLWKEGDVSTFQATWEEAMDDAIAVGNLISKDIKIGLILKEIPESWKTFTTMNNIKSLPESLIKILQEVIQRQINQWPWLLQSIGINNINQQIDNNIKHEKGKLLSQMIK